MTAKENAALNRCGLFQNIGDGERAQLLRCLGARTAEYRKNDIIWRPGDSVQACGLILSGQVRAETVSAAGTRAVSAVHGPGSLVGDVLMATPGGRSPVYVIASDRVKLLFLPYSRIMGGCEKCCSRHALLRENLLSEIARKFWAQRRRTGYLTARSLRQRIAMYLLDESAGRSTFSLGVSREDLAAFLGVNRSALSRELGRMKKEGILDFSRDTFRLAGPSALERCAE